MGVQCERVNNFTWLNVTRLWTPRSLGCVVKTYWTQTFRSYLVIVATDSRQGYDILYVTPCSLVDRYLYFCSHGRRGCVFFTAINLCNRLILDECCSSKQCSVSVRIKLLHLCLWPFYTAAFHFGYYFLCNCISRYLTFWRRIFLSNFSTLCI